MNKIMLVASGAVLLSMQSASATAQSGNLRYCTATSNQNDWRVISKSSYYTLIPQNVQFRGTEDTATLTFRVQENGDMSFAFSVGLYRYLGEADIYMVIADGRKIYETRWQHSNRTVYGEAKTLPMDVVEQLRASRTVEFRVVQRRSSREIFQGSATVDMTNFSEAQAVGTTRMTRLNRDRVAGRCRE